MPGWIRRPSGLLRARCQALKPNYKWLNLSHPASLEANIDTLPQFIPLNLPQDDMRGPKLGYKCAESLIMLGAKLRLSHPAGDLIMYKQKYS